VHKLDRLDLLPPVLTHAFGFGLPWLEIMVGVYLLLGLFTRLTASVAVVLLAFFAFSLGVWIARGETQGCSCTMGASNNPIANVFLGGTSIGVPDVLRDGALILAALALVALGSGCLAVDNVLRHALGHAGVDQ
jgi:uncharacterized membrane protein YphA (DoxX/SURF4 family)